MRKPTIYADFNNADARGRLRLNCVGTIRDLGRKGLRLEEGLQVLLQDDELQADGVALFSEEEQIWVASIDWRQIHSPSEA